MPPVWSGLNSYGTAPLPPDGVCSGWFERMKLNRPDAPGRVLYNQPDERESTLAKTALITGASQGLGAEMARRLASDGFQIAVNCRSQAEVENGGNAVAAACRAYGVEAACFICDVTGFEACGEMVKAVKERFGSIDVLVNNAGITKDGLMLKMTEGQWDAVIAVNLKSAFNFIHAVTPIMMRQRHGSIINMASVVGVHGNAGQANYAASKAGLIALAKSIAQEVGSRGIRANAIAPGFIETAMTAALSDDVRKAWAQKIPLRRAGQVEDIANVATFLASDMSSYVSGQVIEVDGGMNM